MKNLLKNKKVYKNEFKSNKAITLIALIITVIIMLILAGVAISAVIDSEGLFSKTRAGAELYNNAIKDENATLSNLMNYIDRYLMGGTVNPDSDGNGGNGGAGSDEEEVPVDTILIYNKEDLEEFKSNVNNGNTYEGMTVKLMADIDLGGDPNNSETWWTPIGAVGSVSNKFSGTFDGNNYEIEGIYNNVEATPETKNIGFFVKIENATIKNLTLSGDILLGANSEEASLAAGGFVCTAWGDCFILDCINKVNITKESTGRDVAGFVSGMEQDSILTIRNCVNYGNISGANNCAGFVGNMYLGKQLIIENSCNKGTIINYVGNYAGGMVGRDEPSVASSIIISNSYNEGTIRAKSDIGGLVGRINNSITINNSYNIGYLYSEQRTAYRCIGGLIGKIVETSENCSILNSYNKGDLIIAEVDGEYNTNVGGLIGDTRAINTDIINSYNLGNISNSLYAAGICGIVNATDITFNLNNCYNAGEILGTNTSGITIIYKTAVTANITNAYYLDTSANIGVYNFETETDLENPLYDTATRLTDAQMKAQSFVDDLNGNIETEYDLRKWKLVTGSYPEFE